MIVRQPASLAAAAILLLARPEYGRRSPAETHDERGSWYITNNPTTQNMTKQTLGNRSFINQVKYSPKYQSVAIVGTNDANVWIGFNLGTGAQSQANWVDVTGNNTDLPNRPVLGIASILRWPPPISLSAMQRSADSTRIRPPRRVMFSR